MEAISFEPLLEQWAEAFEKLSVTEDLWPKLATYLNHLWMRNQSLNLVSRKMTVESLITDHLLDSLLGLPHLPDADLIADLGTGGGFPAIPLAICRPASQFLLYEKSPLKCKFLRELQTICPNLELVGRLEPEARFEEADLVISRAFKPIKQSLALTKAHFERGAPYLFFKARLARINEELTVAGNPPARLIRLTPHGLAEERHLVLING